jgi:GT2 family glycosyltransferase
MESTSNTQKRIIVVLGMHRSGTSAVTRALTTLGVELGDKLLPPVPGDNDKGYWEDVDILQFNNELLAHFNRDWDSLQPLAPRVLREEVPPSFWARAEELLAARLDAHPLFGLKDPRMAILLPFWQQVFSRLGLRHHYVISSRHPYSVARSMARGKRRGEIQPEKSHLLWLWHQYCALKHTAGKKRLVIDYDHLIQEPRIQLDRMASILGLPLQAQPQREFLDNFLQADLRHSFFPDEALENDPQVPDLAARLYRCLLEMARDSQSPKSSPLANLLRQVETYFNQPALFGLLDTQSRHIKQRDRRLQEQGEISLEQQQALDHLSGKLEELNRQLHQQQLDADTLREKCETLKTALAEKDKALAEKDKALATLYASSSWRLTAPLRAAANHIRHNRQRLRDARARCIRLQQRVQQEGLLQVVRALPAALQARRSQAEATSLSSHYAQWVAHNDTLTPERVAELRDQLEAFPHHPRISVLMPTYNPDLQWLHEAVCSVRRQIYPHWQLCIADDCSSDARVREALEALQAQDPRIKIVIRPENGHIAAASNSAFALADGDWVALLDQDDLLSDDALFHVARAINQQPQAQLIYSDEDKLSPTGERTEPFLKPDWSPHLAISQSYLGHLVCLERDLMEKIGGFDPQLSGAQDYDLWLRAALEARKVIHIPRILYHWRMHQDSTALAAGSKPYAHEAGRRAVQKYLDRRYPGRPLQAIDGHYLFTYRARFTPARPPMVSIIIPLRDKVELLRDCIESIHACSNDVPFEIIIVDNGSVEQATHEYLQTLTQSDERSQVLAADIPFNWSRLNNLAAERARGDVLLFLNNDTRVITPGWLDSLAGYALLPDVGVVGGLLFFEDGTIQHSGVVVGMNGWADHLFSGCPDQHPGPPPFVSPVITRNTLAVTGACMAIAADRFRQLGGFDEAFTICGSDVEICLRAHRQGYFNVICAESQLYHYESKTRTSFVPISDFRQSEQKYAPYRTEQIDPFFHPALRLDSTTPALRKEGAQHE